MENLLYPPLGPPIKQPRETLFSPQITRRGCAKVSISLPNERSENDAKNLQELKEFHVQDVDNKNVPILAGDVIIAAKPFVYVLSTRYENSF
jgi:hypothetical protein